MILLLRRHRNDGLVIILGERYWVYPQTFTEFLVRHMVEHVSGVPDRETAEDKLRGHFNETRKRSKREQLVVKVSLRNPFGFRCLLIIFRRHGLKKTPTRAFPSSAFATRTRRAKSTRSPRNPRCVPLPTPTTRRWRLSARGRRNLWRGWNPPSRPRST